MPYDRDRWVGSGASRRAVCRVLRVVSRTGGRRSRWWGWAIGALLAAAGLVLSLADWLGINRAVGFAALVAGRNAVTVACAAGLVVALPMLVWRRGRPVTGPVALGLAIVTAASGVVALGRGYANASPARPTAGQLRILSWNTNGGLVDPPTIAALAARLRATILVLPDADITDTAGYDRAFRAARYPMRLAAAHTSSEQIAVYLAAPYDRYYDRIAAGPDPTRTLRLASSGADLPNIVAVHAPQPTRRGTAPWNADLNWVADQCRTGQVVAVGDFNATADSIGAASLGHCADAALDRHAGSVGTWPTALPAWLGMPLDHVLATRSWHARTFTVITDQDDSGALHRPIFTVLTR